MSSINTKDWELFVKKIQTSTFVITETKQEKQARLDNLKSNYRVFVRYYFPHYAESECADYHVEIAENLRDNKKINQINVIYRGGAKSTHVNLLIPCWLIFFYQQINLMVLVGENEQKASLLLRDIQSEMQYNQRIIADFESQMQQGNWSDGEFRIKAGTLFKSLGINQDPRGLRNQQHRIDYISVDDIDTRKKANNQVIVAEQVSKILGALKGGFGRDSQRLVISNNLIHKQGILSNLIEKLKHSPRTKIVWANAIDENGLPTWSARYSLEYWAEIKADTPPAEFEREFMNNPIEEGRIFNVEWLQYKPMQYKEYERLICYGDLSYKAQGDYKAFVLVGQLKSSEEIHILKTFIRKTTLQEVALWCYELRNKIADNIVIDFYIEANFIQDLMLDTFYEIGKSQGKILNIRGDYRQKPEKFQRIEAMTLYFHRNLIFINQTEKENKDMRILIEQLLMFEKGSSVHDDAPDALEGAIYLLQKQKQSSQFTPRVGRFFKGIERLFK